MYLETCKMLERRLPHHATAALCVALLVPLAACFGTVADVHHRHYVLDGAPKAATEAPAQELMPGQQPAPQASLWVKDFQIDAVYDRAQLVRRLAPHEVEFVRDEVWAARLGRMLADAVARTWLAHNHFATINRTAGEATQDFTLTAEVTAIEIDKSVHPTKAHLAWVLQLVANRTGKVLGQHVFDAAVPLESGGGHGEAAAAAFNTLLDRAAMAGGAALGPLVANSKPTKPAPREPLPPAFK